MNRFTITIAALLAFACRDGVGDREEVARAQSAVKSTLSPADDLVPTKDGRFVGECAGNACKVSLVQLLATPERFHKKKVQTYGWFKRWPEENVVYLDEASSKFNASDNGIVVRACSTCLPPKLEIDGHLVIIAGVFDAADCGRHSMYGGVLTEIVRVEPVDWSIDPLDDAREESSGK